VCALLDPLGRGRQFVTVCRLDGRLVRHVGPLARDLAAAPKFAVEVMTPPLRGSNEIEAAMAQWGSEPNFGLIVVPDPATNAHRKLINELAARYRLPVIHALRAAAADGGLMSYGVDLPNVFRQTAAYGDRIKNPPGELSIDPVADELLVRVTAWVGASTSLPGDVSGGSRTGS
jgi:hypothetical protein